MALNASIPRFARRAACAAALLALTADFAAAAPALVTGPTNLRQAPGIDAAIIGRIPGGTTVEVTGCSGEWCTVFWAGRRGYAIARNLDRGARPRTPCTIRRCRANRGMLAFKAMMSSVRTARHRAR